MGKVISLIKTHKGIFFTLCFIALLATATTIVFVKRLREAQEQGWWMLFVAQELAFQGQLNKSQEVLSQLEGRYPRGLIKDFIKLTRANFYAQTSSWKEALENYQAVINRNKATHLLPLANLGMAKCYEALGELEKAEKQYRGFIDSYPDHFAAPEAYDGLARVAKMGGKFQEFKETLEKLRVLYPDTLWASRAEAKLKALAENIQKTLPK